MIIVMNNDVHSAMWRSFMKMMMMMMMTMTDDTDGGTDGYGDSDNKNYY